MADDGAVPASFSIMDNLDRIKEQLSLSVTQMAELFNVTRKAVYDWYEGAEPRSATIARISALAEVLASAPAKAEFQQLKAVWKVPASGRSFLAVLNDEKLDAFNLRQALVDKLHELSPRLAAQNRTSLRTSVDLGQAHLADVDRGADFI
jgi:transcriptional regulator with XRE-family HTH domain